MELTLDLCCGILIYGAGIFGILVMLLSIMPFFEYRNVKKDPASRIDSMGGGKVKVKGTAKFFKNTGPEVFSSLTRVPCIYHKTEVKKKIRVRHAGWRTIWKNEYHCSFMISDGTGMVIIEGNGATVFPKTKKLYNPPLFTKDYSQEQVQYFLEKFQLNKKDLFVLDPILKIHEEFIPVDSEVIVYGEVIEEGVDSGPYGGRMITNVIKKRRSSGEIFISDKEEKFMVKSLFWRFFGFFLFGLIITLPAVLALAIQLSTLF